MKMAEALAIIEHIDGYMVFFEHVRPGGILASDNFPDKHAGETLIRSEVEAWNYARRFAEKTRGKCVNICVIDSNWNSVDHYPHREIKNR